MYDKATLPIIHCQGEACKHVRQGYFGLHTPSNLILVINLVKHYTETMESWVNIEHDTIIQGYIHAESPEENADFCNAVDKAMYLQKE